MDARTKLGKKLGGSKMKGIEAFKEEIMYDSDLADYFYGVESMEEMVEKAREKGFDFTVDDLQQDELSEEIFESVCGGKGDQTTTTLDLYSGDGSTVTSLGADSLLKMLVVQGKITKQQYLENIDKFQKNKEV